MSSMHRSRRSLKAVAGNYDVVDTLNLRQTIDANPSHERLRESYSGASGVIERTVVAPTEEQRRLSKRLPLSERTNRAEMDAYETFQNETGRGRKSLDPQLDRLKLKQAKAAERRTREGQSKMAALVRRTQKDIAAMSDVEGADNPRLNKNEANYRAAIHQAERALKGLGKSKKAGMTGYHEVQNELQELEYQIAMEYIEGRDQLSKLRRGDEFLTNLEINYGKKRKKVNQLQGTLQQLMAEQAQIISRREAEAKQAALTDQKSAAEDVAKSKSLLQKPKPLTAAEKKKAQQEAELAIIMQARQSARAKEGLDEMQAKFKSAMSLAEKRKSVAKTTKRKDPGEGTSQRKAKIPQQKTLEGWDDEEVDQIKRAREMYKSGLIPEFQPISRGKGVVSTKDRTQAKTPKTPKKGRPSQPKSMPRDSDVIVGWDEQALAEIALARERLKTMDLEALFKSITKRTDTKKTPAKTPSKMSIKKQKKEKISADYDPETGQWTETLMEQIKQAREVYKAQKEQTLAEVTVDREMSKTQLTKKGKTPGRKASKISIKKSTDERIKTVESSDPLQWPEAEMAQILLAREIWKAKQSMAPQEGDVSTKSERLKRGSKIAAKKKKATDRQKKIPEDFEAISKAWEEQARAEVMLARETAKMGTAVERALAEEAAAKRAIILKANELFTKSLKAADLSIGDSLSEMDLHFAKHQVGRKSLPALPSRSRLADEPGYRRSLSFKPDDENGPRQTDENIEISKRSKSIPRRSSVARRSVSRARDPDTEGGDERRTSTKMTAELYSSKLSQPKSETIPLLKPLGRDEVNMLKENAYKEFALHKKQMQQASLPEEDKRVELKILQDEHALRLHLINNMDKYKHAAVKQFDDAVDEILKTTSDPVIRQENIEFWEDHLNDMLNNIEEFAGMPRPHGTAPLSIQAKLQVAEIINNALISIPGKQNERLSMALQRSVARETGQSMESSARHESMLAPTSKLARSSKVQPPSKLVLPSRQSEVVSSSQLEALGDPAHCKTLDKSESGKGRRPRSKSVAAKQIIVIRPKHSQADPLAPTDYEIYTSHMTNDNVANALDKSSTGASKCWKLDENVLQAIRLKKQLEKHLQAVSKEQPITKEVLKVLETGERLELPVSNSALQSLATGLRLDPDVELPTIATEAAERSFSLKRTLENLPPEVAKKLPVTAHQSPLQQTGADNIFQMMMNQSEGVDLEAPPGHVVPLLVPPEGPHIKLAGRALENEGILIDNVPMQDINAMDDVAAADIAAAALNQRQHVFPALPLAARRLSAIRIEIEPADADQNEQRRREDFLQQPVLLHSFGVETFFQSRGTTHPKWFPGMYIVFPEDDPRVILKKSPSEVLQKAWEMLKPNYNLRKM